MSGRWLGIDFSGNVHQWRPTRRKSNIWVAEVREDDTWLGLTDLRRVQDLPGDAPPFERLAALLQGTFSAAAIDAPFSVPASFVSNYPELLRLVAQSKPEDRAFARGAKFVEAVTGRPPPLSPPKPFRATDEVWQHRGVNVRSTLWTGPRGGAPMTAACLTLLGLVGGPIWPFTHSGVPSLLVEAFPAAQLRAWGLPHQGYGKTIEGAPNRGAIVEHLKTRLHLGRFEPEMRGSADALDAVLCAFAAIAVTEGKLLDEPGEASQKEGWIAVHR
jgi:predicted nuclease with RNAse H fold